jgi:multiple antibiotic resistance protein
MSDTSNPYSFKRVRVFFWILVYWVSSFSNSLFRVFFWASGEAMLYLKETLSVTIVLFSVIDILGSLPVVVDMKSRSGQIKTRQATLTAGLLMVAFLFIGERILHLFGMDNASFAVAGALVILAVGTEMVLGIDVFKQDPSAGDSNSIVPLAFPMIDGAGTLTTILTLKSEFAYVSILFGIMLNLGFVYAVLNSSDWLEAKLGPSGLSILRKVFGIILLGIAIKLIRTNLMG